MVKKAKYLINQNFKMLSFYQLIHESGTEGVESLRPVEGDHANPAVN
jgi:hypothetical protein